MTGLTFDWDNVSLDEPKVREGLELLAYDFPLENIWIRVSSSQQGLHVMIAQLIWEVGLGQYILEPIPMISEDQMQYRQKFVKFGLECSGRLRSDIMRQVGNLRTSRVFFNKNGNTATKWQSYLEVLNTSLVN